VTERDDLRAWLARLRVCASGMSTDDLEAIVAAVLAWHARACAACEMLDAPWPLG
jgi:hypothetical protein